MQLQNVIDFSYNFLGRQRIRLEIMILERRRLMKQMTLACNISKIKISSMKY